MDVITWLVLNGLTAEAMLIESDRGVSTSRRFCFGLLLQGILVFGVHTQGPWFLENSQGLFCLWLFMLIRGPAVVLILVAYVLWAQTW